MNTFYWIAIIWYVIGIVFVLISYPLRKDRTGSLGEAIKHFIIALGGPLLFVIAIWLFKNQNKLKDFASIALVIYPRIRKTGLYLNTTLVHEFDIIKIADLTPYARKYENVTIMTDRKGRAVVKNLEQLVEEDLDEIAR